MKRLVLVGIVALFVFTGSALAARAGTTSYCVVTDERHFPTDSAFGIDAYGLHSGSSYAISATRNGGVILSHFKSSATTADANGEIHVGFANGTLPPGAYVYNVKMTGPNGPSCSGTIVIPEPTPQPTP